MGKSCIPWSEDTGETVTQLCLTLCDHMDCSPPGSSVNEILQARILECLAIPFSRGSSKQGIEIGSPTLWTDSLLSEPPGSPISNNSRYNLLNSLLVDSIY